MVRSNICYSNVSRGLYLLYFEALCVNVCGKSGKRTDLGGSSNYSYANFEDCWEEGFHGNFGRPWGSRCLVDGKLVVWRLRDGECTHSNVRYYLLISWCEVMLVVGHLQKGNMCKFMCRGDDWVTSDTLLSSWVPKRCGFSPLLVSLLRKALMRWVITQVLLSMLWSFYIGRVPVHSRDCLRRVRFSCYKCHATMLEVDSPEITWWYGDRVIISKLFSSDYSFGRIIHLIKQYLLPVVRW